MPRASEMFIATRKEVSATDYAALSDRLFTKGGYVLKHGSGLFSYTETGLNVLRKSEQLVRRAINTTGAREILMPFIQPGELWQESGRLDEIGPELGRFVDRHEHLHTLSPTQEEVVTDIFRRTIHSYRRLPVCLYHINLKFRDEIRPRFGLLRAREFLMMDAYSFDRDAAGLASSYEGMDRAYRGLLDDLKLDYVVVAADTGTMGGKESHEFHLLADVGEDDLVVCPACGSGWNAEMDLDFGEICANCDERGLQRRRGIEVGHIFKLGTRYTESMNVSLPDEGGGAFAPIMGSYGIGVSRLIAAAAEQLSDEKRLRLPRQMWPWDVWIVPAGTDDALMRGAEELYASAHAAGLSAVLDDRDGRLGMKLADAELSGVGNIVVVGRGYAANGTYEVRLGNECVEMSLDPTVSALVSPAS
jgi:prolyl-tRNA synthetase